MAPRVLFIACKQLQASNLNARLTLSVTQVSCGALDGALDGEIALRPKAQLAHTSLLRAERSLRSSRSVNQLTLSLRQLT